MYQLVEPATIVNAIVAVDFAPVTKISAVPAKNSVEFLIK